LFTGLIVDMGQITSLGRRSGGATLSLRLREGIVNAAIGDSIAVNGTCLTVVDKYRDELSFDLSEETLQSTDLGNLKMGDMVNIEPSLRPDSKIGGHFVTGHIDSVGQIVKKIRLGDMLQFEFRASSYVMQHLVEKGSIAVDGISLTVVDILEDSFTVVVIPHTAKMTTLGQKEPGDSVNLEVDILSKYVARFLKKDRQQDSRLLNTLREKGYVNSQE
jgi:riboflavin synthase